MNVEAGQRQLGPPSARRDRLTPAQRQQESALGRAIFLDLLLAMTRIAAAIMSGSLTLLADIPRSALLLLIEIIAFVTLRRANRGKFFAYEYGTGKIERVITVLIAGGLCVAAIFVIGATIGRLQHPTVLSTPGLVLAVAYSSTNLWVNAYFAGKFIRSNAVEHSRILESQIRMRIVKTVVSIVVVLVLVAATCVPDPKGVVLIDASGAFFVAGYMIYIGTQMLRESLPDLLDRALPEHQQLVIMRTIAQNFDHFDQFREVRSRQSGGCAFINIRLMFEPTMSLRQVNRVCGRVKAQLEEALPGSEVSVLPDVHLRGE
jgi:ferrous-iron efflux pump FieF